MSIFNIPAKFRFFDFSYKMSPRFIDFAKKSGLSINEDVIHDAIVGPLGEAWKQARQNAPVAKIEGGFLRDHIFVYMTTKTMGFLAAEADYSAAQEFGYRNRAGNFIKGKHFMMPAAQTARKEIEANMKILEKAFVEGVKPLFKTAAVSAKSGYPSSAKKPSRAGSRRRTSARKKPVYSYYSSVTPVSFKKVQLFGMYPRGRGRKFSAGT